MEGKTQFIIATKEVQRREEEGTQIKKKQAQQECDECRSFLGEQNTLKCFERRGDRRGGAITDTAPCSSKLQLTITAINVVEDYSYK